MTSFNTGAGHDGYFLRFETDDKEQYLYMQEAARLCLDGKIKGNTSSVYPERHAHWLRPFPTTPKSYVRICSVCKGTAYAIGKEYDYCPNCQAVMDEEVER